MSVTLKSTKAIVRNPEKVREILASYEWVLIEIQFREENAKWTLEMNYDDDDDEDMDAWHRPAFVKIEDLPDEEEFPDEDAYYDARIDVFHNKGDEGFLALLGELAAHLESPFLILYAEASLLDGFGYGAEVWRVEPGVAEVEHLEL